MKVSIIIPAHNEEQRIQRTLESYHGFFTQKPEQVEFVVVLNGCTDNTIGVVKDLAARLHNIIILDLPQAGKGLAIKAGFKNALLRGNGLIGFVDADGATQPEYFYELIKQIDVNGGIIASRYMPGSKVYPERPLVKRLGKQLIYDSLVWLLFGLKYYDTQCGAKLFTKNLIEVIASQLTIKQWAFDVELLYLCKRHGFNIKEVPTTWHDQEGSKLKILGGGLPMLSALFKMRHHYSWFD